MLHTHKHTQTRARARAHTHTHTHTDTLVAWLTSAPLSSSSLTTSRWPFWAACMKPVHPSCMCVCVCIYSGRATTSRSRCPHQQSSIGGWMARARRRAQMHRPKAQATRPPMCARALPLGAPTGGACRRETLRGSPAPHPGGSGGEGGAPIASDRRRRGARLAVCMGAPLLWRRRLGPDRRAATQSQGLSVLCL